jgi:hypothetical protein
LDEEVACLPQRATHKEHSLHHVMPRIQKSVLDYERRIILTEMMISVKRDKYINKQVIYYMVQGEQIIAAP